MHLPPLLGSLLTPLQWHATNVYLLQAVYARGVCPSLKYLASSILLSDSPVLYPLCNYSLRLGRIP